MVTLIYAENGGVAHEQDTPRLPELMADESRTFWVDLESPSEEEFSLLRDVFQFHPLAIEDARHPHQRPKLDEYENHLFLTADEVTLDPNAYETPAKDGDEEAVQSRQMSAFLGDHYLVTVHVAPVAAVRGLRDRCDHNRHVLKRGADFVLYSLLDVLVDGYFPLLDTLDDRIDDLEDRIVEQTQRSTLDTIFAMKRDLTRLRKHAGPQREVLQTLTTRDLPGVHTETLPYFRDVADHLFRVYEALDGYRDLMSDMLGAYLSQVSNEMNRVMQKLSVVATVFLPITFITGVFGMNFEKQPWIKTDFWFWMFLMSLVAGGTYWWFHRKRFV
jgi:magnesium transporter